MYLVVSHPRGERRYHGPALAGAVVVGSAREADVQIEGHRIAARHVVLRFPAPGRTGPVRIEVRNAYGVRLDGRLPRPHDVLGRLTIGVWTLWLDDAPETGVGPLDAELLATIARAPDADDARAVYADSLEERGRLAEAELVRGATDPLLAARTPPELRQLALPILVEGCREGCGRRWTPSACPRCGALVPLHGNLGPARERALAGRPVALDPSVRRFPNDLREPVVRQPAIVMGQPRR